MLSVTKVYYGSPYNSTQFAFVMLKFPPIVHSTVDFRLTCKLEYFICAVLVTA